MHPRRCRICRGNYSQTCCHVTRWRESSTSYPGTDYRAILVIHNTGQMGTHKSNLESHWVRESFAHLTLCVRRCWSPATTSTNAFGLKWFDLMLGNGRLLACVTESMTVSVRTVIDTYRAHPLSWSISHCCITEMNEYLFWPHIITRKRTKKPLSKFKLQSRDTDGRCCWGHEESCMLTAIG